MYRLIRVSSHWNSVCVAMCRRETSQAGRRRPKRNSVGTIRPKSANRRDLIRSNNEWPFVIPQAQARKKGFVVFYSFTTQVPRCVYMSIRYSGVPTKKGSSDKNRVSRWSIRRASEQERVDHREWPLLSAGTCLVDDPWPKPGLPGEPRCLTRHLYQ